MDPEVWKHLADHEDILRLVLVRVSWDTNIRLRPVSKLPFGRRNEFSVTRSAKGLLLLETRHLSDGSDNENLYLHELDRFLFNPLTQDFSKLPPVPRNPLHGINCSLEYPMIITVDNDRVIRVVAVELGREQSNERWWKIIRILIWQENGSRGWEAANLNDPASSRFSQRLEQLTEGVFAAGKLFLNTKCRNPQLGKGGYRIMECNWETHSVMIGDFDPNPIQHLFQHRGVLMRLTGTWREVQPQSLKLCTFDHLNETWLEESTTEMPEQMVNRFYDTLDHERNTFVHVEGDILCIGNVYRGEFLLLYNLLRRSWTEVCAKYLMDQDENNPNRRISLWSPSK
ncbi:hypothetical protein R1sor_019156 [Riccia sorocarpa]|uniref:F-box associated domain-containing protein n=1 Tax=Riccia sorocarpa TaxID=122646 RepID=A0ABD3IHX8_9MARC